jgi:hypothetical protein
VATVVATVVGAVVSASGVVVGAAEVAVVVFVEVVELVVLVSNVGTGVDAVLSPSPSPPLHAATTIDATAINAVIRTRSVVGMSDIVVEDATKRVHPWCTW